MKSKTLIFDLGNVLVEVNPKRSIQKIQAQVPHQSIKDVFQLIDQSNVKRQYELGKLDNQTFYEQMRDMLHVDMSFEFFRNLWKDFFTAIRPMIDLLPKLKKSYCLVMLSDTNPMHIEACQEQFDFFHYFDHFIFSYQCGLMKPDPAIYHLALKQSQTKPEEAVFIDDKLENVEGAQQVGIYGFHYQNTEHFIQTFPFLTETKLDS